MAKKTRKTTKAAEQTATAETARNDDNWAEKIGKPSFDAIAEMVAALQCDYKRLEELRDERNNLKETLDDLGDDTSACGKRSPEYREAAKALKEWEEQNGDELKELETAAGDCENEEQARQRIEEDPLSLELRSGWTSPNEEMQPEEFCLLLGTGGPAVRIIGELGEDKEPYNPRLQVQDWFKPWTDYVPADEDVLLAYCHCFYFGE